MEELEEWQIDIMALAKRREPTILHIGCSNAKDMNQPPGSSAAIYKTELLSSDYNRKTECHACGVAIPLAMLDAFRLIM